MHTEYEVRVLEIDKEEIIKRLEQLGAEFQWDYVQRRYVYDFIPKVESKWIRLRTNGKETTLTYKSVEKDSIDFCWCNTVCIMLSESRHNRDEV